MQSTYTRHKNLFNFNFPVFNTFWISQCASSSHFPSSFFFYLAVRINMFLIFNCLMVPQYHTDNCIVNEIMAKVLTKQRLLAKLIVLLLIFFNAEFLEIGILVFFCQFESVFQRQLLLVYVKEFFGNSKYLPSANRNGLRSFSSLRSHFPSSLPSTNLVQLSLFLHVSRIFFYK